MEKKDFYEGEYMPQMHKIGKLTGLLGAVLSFLPGTCTGSCVRTSSKTCCTCHLHLFLQQVHSDFSGL